MRTDRERVLEVLEHGHWFGNLPAELRWEIVAASRVRRFRKGQLVLQQGAPSPGIFAVLAGRVEISSWIGDELVLLTIGERGFWFGDDAAFARAPSQLNSTARTDSTILLLPVNELHRLWNHPSYHRHLAELILERYAVALKWAIESRGLPASGLLRSRLDDLVRLRREADDEADPVLPLSQSEVAALVGVSRQTVNSLLGQLEEERLIERGFRSIRVLDETALVQRPDEPRI